MHLVEAADLLGGIHGLPAARARSVHPRRSSDPSEVNSARARTSIRARARVCEGAGARPRGVCVGVCVGGCVCVGGGGPH